MPLKLACKTMLTREMAWYRASLFSVQFSRDGTILKAKHMPKQLKTLKCILLDASSDKWKPSVAVYDPYMRKWTHHLSRKKQCLLRESHLSRKVQVQLRLWCLWNVWKCRDIYIIDNIYIYIYIYILCIIIYLTIYICVYNYTCIIHRWLNCSFARWLGHGYFPWPRQECRTDSTPSPCRKFPWCQGVPVCLSGWWDYPLVN